MHFKRRIKIGDSLSWHCTGRKRYERFIHWREWAKVSFLEKLWRKHTKGRKLMGKLGCRNGGRGVWGWERALFPSGDLTGFQHFIHSFREGACFPVQRANCSEHYVVKQEWRTTRSFLAWKFNDSWLFEINKNKGREKKDEIWDSNNVVFLNIRKESWPCW